MTTQAPSHLPYLFIDPHPAPVPPDAPLTPADWEELTAPAPSPAAAATERVEATRREVTAPAGEFFKSATVYHDREAANARSYTGRSYGWRYEIIKLDGTSILGGCYCDHAHALAAMNRDLCELAADRADCDGTADWNESADREANQ